MPAKAFASLETWQRRRDQAFGTHRALIVTPGAAESFLDRVGIALRYNATSNLPLASLQRVFAGDDPDKAAAARAIEQTNHLLGTGVGIEVHVVADRVALVHRRLMPALYVLVRRRRPLDDHDGLSLNARTALSLLRERKEASAGDVRRRLGLHADPRNDPAYAALGELLRVLLVDRGPFEIPKKGIAYLPPEGYPYHLLHEAHADVVAAAKKVTVDAAADTFLSSFLDAAVFAQPRKLVAMFKRCLSRSELDAALARLTERGSVREEMVGSTRYVVSRGE